MESTPGYTSETAYSNFQKSKDPVTLKMNL